MHRDEFIDPATGRMTSKDIRDGVPLHDTHRELPDRFDDEEIALHGPNLKPNQKDALSMSRLQIEEAFVEHAFFRAKPSFGSQDPSTMTARPVDLNRSLRDALAFVLYSKLDPTTLFMLSSLTSEELHKAVESSRRYGVGA